MSTRLYTTQHTVPAGTTAAAPLIQPVTLEDNRLDQIEIIIPDGHAGFTGIAIRSNTAPLVPFDQGTFIVGNNEPMTFPIDTEIGANQLSVVTFNTGVYAHTFYVRWTISDLFTAPAVTIVSPQQSAPAAPADIASILGITGVVG